MSESQQVVWLFAALASFGASLTWSRLAALLGAIFFSDRNLKSLFEWLFAIAILIVLLSACWVSLMKVVGG